MFHLIAEKNCWNDVLDSIDFGKSYVQLGVGSFSNEFLKKRIDSGQPYLRLRVGSSSNEFLKKSIDLGQSYLRLKVG